MGYDGLEGVKVLKEHCPQLSVIAQDQKSSIVWGMPKAIIDHNLQDATMSLEQITAYMSQLL